MTPVEEIASSQMEPPHWSPGESITPPSAQRVAPTASEAVSGLHCQYHALIRMHMELSGQHTASAARSPPMLRPPHCCQRSSCLEPSGQAADAPADKNICSLHMQADVCISSNTSAKFEQGNHLRHCGRTACIRFILTGMHVSQRHHPIKCSINCTCVSMQQERAVVRDSVRAPRCWQQYLAYRQSAQRTHLPEFQPILAMCSSFGDREATSHPL